MTSTISVGRCIRGALAVAVLCALSLVMPFVAFAVAASVPANVSNSLFFMPQYVFPTVWRTNVPSPQVHPWWSLPIWLLIAIIFGLVSPRWRFPFVALGAIVLFLVVITLLQVAILNSPFTFQLDGP